MVWVEDSEELRATDEDHLTHVGRLPTCDVVPHPRAACEEGNHGERAARRPHTHAHITGTHHPARALPRPQAPRRGGVPLQINLLGGPSLPLGGGAGTVWPEDGAPCPLPRVAQRLSGQACSRKMTQSWDLKRSTNWPDGGWGGGERPAKPRPRKSQEAGST